MKGYLILILLCLCMSTFYLASARDASSTVAPVAEVFTSENATDSIDEEKLSPKVKFSIMKSLGKSVKSYIVRIKNAVFSHSLIIGPVVVTAFVVGVTVLTHRNRFS